MNVTKGLCVLALTSVCALFAPAAAVQAAPLPLALAADTVLGGPCVLSSNFKAGDKIIFRVRVLDTATGEPVDADGLKSLVIKMSDGSEHAAKFGPHPPKDPIAGYYWTLAWTVPADYPTGSFPYTVVATSLSGETVTYVPFEAPKSQLMIVAAQ